MAPASELLFHLSEVIHRVICALLLTGQLQFRGPEFCFFHTSRVFHLHPSTLTNTQATMKDVSRTAT